MKLKQVTRVAGYGLLVEDERILLCRISEHSPDGGKWTLPGGGIEFGEDPVDAMICEVSEETGLHVASAGLAGVNALHVEAIGTAYHQIRIIYFARILGGTLRSETDGSTDLIRWWPASNDADLADLARVGIELAFRK